MYNHRLMDDGQNVKRPALPVKVEEILLPHGADKLIDRTTADEKLPMTAASNFGKKVLLRVVEVDPGQGAAGVIMELTGRSANPSTPRIISFSTGAKTSCLPPSVNIGTSASLAVIAVAGTPPRRDSTASASLWRRGTAVIWRSRFRRPIWLKASIMTANPIAAYK